LYPECSAKRVGYVKRHLASIEVRARGGVPEHSGYNQLN